MFSFADRVADPIGFVKDQLRGREVTLHALSGAEERALKDAFKRPAAPMKPAANKPGEWMTDENDPAYLNEMELWIYRRAALENLASLRVTATAGSIEYPRGGDAAAIKAWAQAIWPEADRELATAEVDRLYAVVQSIATNRGGAERGK